MTARIKLDPKDCRQSNVRAIERCIRKLNSMKNNQVISIESIQVKQQNVNIKSLSV